MSVTESLGSGKVWAPPPTPPLNETAWRAWVAKGRTHDRRIGAARGKLVRSVPIAALAVTVAVWSQAAPYESVVRFIVAVAAMFVTFQAFQERHYAVAALFAALALLYNPIAPVFRFLGGGWRALVIASIVPFAVSLFWRDSPRKHNA